MRILIVLFYALFVISCGFSQELHIKSISVSGRVTVIGDMITERMYDGPFLSINAQIKNNHDSTMILTPSRSYLYFSFCYNKIHYEEEVDYFYLSNFLDKEKIELKSNDSIELPLAFRIFYGTKIIKQSKSNCIDYSKELIESLPTLKIYYKDFMNNICSNGIGEVILVDDQNIPQKKCPVPVRRKLLK